MKFSTVQVKCSLRSLKTVFLTLGRFQTDPLKMRWLLLAAAPFWLTHDLLIGSLPAVTADFATLAVGGWALMRESPALRALLVGRERREAC